MKRKVWKMKKFLSILLVVSLIFGVSIPVFGVESQLSESEMKEQQDSIEKFYKDFLIGEGYEEATADWLCEPEEYTTLDIDQNGIPELIIIGYDGDGFCHFSMFYYDVANDQVKVALLKDYDNDTYVTSGYAYGGLTYSEKFQSLVFTELRPFRGAAIYGYHTLQNGYLESSMAVGENMRDDGSIYDCLWQDDQAIEITTEERSEYVKEWVPVTFAFQISDIEDLKKNKTSGVGVSVNGVLLPFTSDSGYPYVDSANRTQVPLRLTMESCGFEVGWNQSEQIATVTDGETLVEVPIGQAYILKDGERIENDTAAVVSNGRTYLPIRVVLEAFGAEVGWDQDTKTVLVIMKNNSVVTIDDAEKAVIEYGYDVYDWGFADGFYFFWAYDSDGVQCLIDLALDDRIAYVKYEEPEAPGYFMDTRETITL